MNEEFPRFRYGLPDKPDFTPAHQVDLLTGIRPRGAMMGRDSLAPAAFVLIGHAGIDEGSGPRMTLGSWKSGAFIIPDDAGGDDLFDFRGDDGSTHGAGITPPAFDSPLPFDSHGLQDLFGRIEDLLSHTVPPEVLQAIHDAFQNIIDHLPQFDPAPTIPDLGHLWHEAWTPPPTSELHEPVNAGGHSEPSNVAVANNALGSKPQFNSADPGPTGLLFHEPTPDQVSTPAHASHDWLLSG